MLVTTYDMMNDDGDEENHCCDVTYSLYIKRNGNLPCVYSHW